MPSHSHQLHTVQLLWSQLSEALPSWLCCHIPKFCKTNEQLIHSLWPHCNSKKTIISSYPITPIVGHWSVVIGSLVCCDWVIGVSWLSDWSVLIGSLECCDWVIGVLWLGHWSIVIGSLECHDWVIGVSWLSHWSVMIGLLECHDWVIGVSRLDHWIVMMDRLSKGPFSKHRHIGHMLATILL